MFGIACMAPPPQPIIIHSKGLNTISLTETKRKISFYQRWKLNCVAGNNLSSKEQNILTYYQQLYKYYKEVQADFGIYI